MLSETELAALEAEHYACPCTGAFMPHCRCISRRQRCPAPLLIAALRASQAEARADRERLRIAQDALEEIAYRDDDDSQKLRPSTCAEDALIQMSVVDDDALAQPAPAGGEATT